MTPAPESDGVRRLIRRGYAVAAMDEFVPLYAVYALLMTAHGIGPGGLSVLLALWSLSAFVLEVPSGALADRVSRRRLLTVAPLFRAVAFGLWTFAPSFASFAIGFLLWGLSDSLTSGTREALLYDELTAAGAEDRYPKLVGRIEVLTALAVIAATALAIPLVAVGGYTLAGVVSIGTSVATGVIAAGFPETPRAESTDEGGLAGYLGTLRAGLREARRSRAVRRAVLVAAFLPGITAVDEYLPLLATAGGAGATLVPVLLLGPYIGLAIGAELAGRRPDLSPRRVAVVVAVGGVALGAGALVAAPIGFLGVAICFGTLWYAVVIADVRLQATMTGDARATVTSLSGFGAEASALALFAGWGVGSAHVGVPVLTAAVAVPTLLLAAVTPRWLPPAAPTRLTRQP